VGLHPPIVLVLVLVVVLDCFPHRADRGRRRPRARSGKIPPPLFRARPYSRSEVIHRAGDESFFALSSVSGPRIVNNFAASATSGYELSSVSEKMNSTRPSNLAVVLGSGNEYSDEDESSLETITSGYKEFASDSGRANDHYPTSRI
jgi:hypothetical protein